MSGTNVSFAIGAMENTIMVDETFTMTPADEFKNNDIVVFRLWTLPISAMPTRDSSKLHWEDRLKRMVAQSGDVLEIKEGELYVNEKLIPLPPTAKIEYEIRTKRVISFPDKKEDDYSALGYQGNEFVYRVLGTSSEIEGYKDSNIISRRKIIRSEYFKEDMLTKPSADLRWTVDYYGPLRIPSPGETIIIDEGNYALYKNLPDVHKGQYTIKEKLYFVMGDNRHFSQDSRYIGFISHSNMKGIVKK